MCRRTKEEDSNSQNTGEVDNQKSRAKIRTTGLERKAANDPKAPSEKINFKHASLQRRKPSVIKKMQQPFLLQFTLSYKLAQDPWSFSNPEQSEPWRKGKAHYTLSSIFLSDANKREGHIFQCRLNCCSIALYCVFDWDYVLIIFLF